MTDWDVPDLAGAYEHLIDRSGAWFTPPEIANVMVRFSIGPQLDRLCQHPDPGNVLQVLAVDPSCGCGVFLVTAAKSIATRYAERLFGEATNLTLAIVLPEVLSETIFGVDIDPIVVDVCKAALWFEVGGEQPITFMDRNIICGDTLAGPHVQPPKLAERLAERSDAISRAATNPAG
jgi:type I restriction-modification system DNA methylase subunit